jgi:serralysin
MATIGVFSGWFDLDDIVRTWDVYNTTSTQTVTKYSLKYNGGHAGLEVEGSNLGYDGARLNSGIVNSVSFFNSDGSPAWKMTGLLLGAKDFRDAAVGNHDSILTLFSSVKFTLNGGVSDDIFRGGTASDTIKGGLGSDDLTGGFGNDIISGGGADSSRPTEIDRADYSQENGGGAIKVDLTKGKVIDTYGTVDTVSGIELFMGGDKADTFVASSKDVYQAFWGGAGNDLLKGGVGQHDVARYDLGDVYSLQVDLDGNADGSGFATGGYVGKDTLIGIDVVIGSSNHDQLFGSKANETFTGNSGQDTINGEGGVDSIDYSFEEGARGVSVNLTNGYAVDTYNYADTLMLIEDVVGTGRKDFITGNALANSLLGGADNDSLRGLGGKDRLDGGSGNDRLAGGGGAGNDTLIGGTGVDTFVFDAALKSNVDTISGFSVADDTICLENAIFSKLAGTGALSSAQFYASTSGVAHDKTDRIIYETDTGKLFYDADGNLAGAAVQFAILDKHPTLTAADFFIT